jgi:ATP-dependent RNA/DNA helicase IGHMBP2
MKLLHLDALPPHTTRGTIVRLLEQVGQLDKRKIGKIEVAGRGASIEVPAAQIAKLVAALDGAAVGNQHIRAWTQASGDSQTSADGVDRHFGRLLALLELEAEEEARQATLAARRSAGEAERSGTTLARLVLRDVDGGLGGRWLATFVSREPGALLPWTRLDVGSPVLLTEEGARGDGYRGIVSARNNRELQVALSRLPEAEGDAATWRVDLSSDEIGRQRQRAALERARTASGERLAALRDVLLDAVPPGFDARRAGSEHPPTLNEVQTEAVQFALSATDFALIHGPPGTGKTTTLVELVRQSVARGEKVLACAPSNLAVDNLLEKLLGRGVAAIRLGHPARVTAELRDHTLDLLVDAHPDVRLARKFIKEANQLREQAGKFTRARPEPGQKQAMRAEAAQLVADARRLESQIVAEILDKADVLCVTNTAIDSEILGQRSFDLAVIDEACQCTEPACWIPLLRCERVVLAGDHCQLPPTVISGEAQKQGFGVSLLERLMASRGDEAARQLTVQYRMHQSIMEFSSHEFYEDTLIAHPSVAEHMLTGLPDVQSDPLTETPLEFVDTAGASYDEALETDGDSRLNEREAALAGRKVQTLLSLGVSSKDIAVIAPYSAQVRLLRQQLATKGVEIDSVDGFQGREKEAVIISLVRSNTNCEIGFLSDVRRMNVALTRARRKLIVIGDSATVGAHAFYARLMEHFELHGAYKSVWEEEEV